MSRLTWFNCVHVIDHNCTLTYCSGLFQVLLMQLIQSRIHWVNDLNQCQISSWVTCNWGNSNLGTKSLVQALSYIQSVGACAPLPCLGACLIKEAGHSGQTNNKRTNPNDQVRFWGDGSARFWAPDWGYSDDSDSATLKQHQSRHRIRESLLSIL